MRAEEYNAEKWHSKLLLLSSGSRRLQSLPFGQITIILILAVMLQGCVPMIVMNSMDHEHYSDYVTKTEQINVEREKGGLQPDPIMTFNQWRGK